MAVHWSRAGLGVVLHRERWLSGQFKTAIAAVKQADMRGRRARRQRRSVHGKAVVHAGDLDRAVR